ncbi:MAG: hypothetical protein LH480_14340 [Rubrivivax sp.]|nr:hypothetical protein [Rubrivivax sp.]
MKPVAALLAGLALALPLHTSAGPGHDHGDEPAAAAGTASPRVSAHSDLFEAVGIVEGKTLTIYLDRYADNAPVVGAKVDVELGSVRGVAAEGPEGVYTFGSESLLKEGPLPVTITVVAGADADLLAGDLVIGHAAATDPTSADHTVPLSDRPRVWLAAGAAALLAVMVAVWRWRWRRRSAGSASLAGAASTSTAPTLPAA